MKIQLYSKTQLLNLNLAPLTIWKRLGTEIYDIDTSTEIGSFRANTFVRNTNHRMENFSSKSVAIEKVRAKSGTDPLIWQMESLRNLMPDLKDEQSSRRCEEIVCSRTSCSSSGIGRRSYSQWLESKFGGWLLESDYPFAGEKQGTHISQKSDFLESQ